MRNYLPIVYLMLIYNSAYATTFVPLPIKKQIVDSSAVIKGEVINTSSYEDASGKIVSKVFIRVDRWIGVTPKNNHIEVLYPGGQVGDRVQLVHGSPTFISGEKVVLLLKENSNKLWIQNLALGKFMIKRYGSTEVIINSVFPNHPKVGQIALNSFYTLTSNIKQKDFQIRFKDKYELEVDKQKIVKFSKQRRKIASISNPKDKAGEKLNIAWLLIILGIMGAFFTFIRKKQHDE